MEQSLIKVIEAKRSSKHYWRELWQYRELFFFLSWRDIKVRYKQTVLGIAWAILQPLLTMLVLTIVFGRIAKMPNDGGAPYAVMVLAALLPWKFFSAALSASSSSLITNSNMVSKIYFPRMIIPISSIVTAGVDFLIAFSILLVMLVYYRFLPSTNIVFLPFFVFLILTITMGMGLVVSVLNVQYRDFRYIIPFIVQFGLYICPVGFSSSVIPQKWQFFYGLNPLVGVIDGFRWCIIGTMPDSFITHLICSCVVCSIILYAGSITFRCMERTFADKI